MDKKVLKQIRHFAAMLPVVSSPCKGKVLGSEILKQNPNAKDAEGNPLAPQKVYMYDARVNHNHVRAMKKIYKSKGNGGLLQYAQMMKDFQEGRIKMLDTVIGGMEERKASLVPGL